MESLKEDKSKPRDGPEFQSAPLFMSTVTHRIISITFSKLDFFILK